MYVLSILGLRSDHTCNNKQKPFEVLISVTEHQISSKLIEVNASLY